MLAHDVNVHLYSMDHLYIEDIKKSGVFEIDQTR